MASYNGDKQERVRRQYQREQQERQRQQQQQQQQRQRLEQYIRMQKYAANYTVQWKFPAVVEGLPSAADEEKTSASSPPPQQRQPPSSSSKLRTDEELIQHRLLEAGVLNEVPVTVSETAEAADRFVRDLERTDCFEAVQVELGCGSGSKQQPRQPPEAQQQQTQQQRLQQAQHRQQRQQHEEFEEEGSLLRVRLQEKKWYRFYLGGGLKTDALFTPELSALSSLSSDGPPSRLLPVAELECTAGLRNLTGNLDQTAFHYALDTKNIASYGITHERPLYSLFPPGSLWRDVILQQVSGSQYSFRASAAVDTKDYEHTRGYQEMQRLLSLRISNQHTVGNNPEHFVASTTAAMTGNNNNNPYYIGLEWNLLFRDLIPQRHPATTTSSSSSGSSTTPSSFPYKYSFAASPEVVSKAGPSVKHSFRAELRTNGTLNHPHLPTQGANGYATIELATPPGDTGFFKATAGGSVHVPIVLMEEYDVTDNENDPFFEEATTTTTQQTTTTTIAALHASVQAGWLRSLSFGGLCPRPATLSDRFYTGGPLPLRGFGPAGIGPRTSASTTQGGGRRGDAVGGDFYHAATVMASVAPTELSFVSRLLQQQQEGGGGGFALGQHALRMFCFANAGTCVGAIHNTPVLSVLQSTRCSVGVGIATSVFGPARVEATACWPLRYGPRDTRRTFQIGIGLSAG